MYRGMAAKSVAVLMGMWLLSPTVTQAQKPTHAKSIVYQSRQAGFRLALPGLWHNNYRTKETITPKPDAPMGQHTVMFLFTPKTMRLKTAEVLLGITVFTPKAWERASKEAGPPLGEEITRKGNKVFVAAFPQSNPFEEKSQEGKLFARMTQNLQQLQQVKKAFTVLK